MSGAESRNGDDEVKSRRRSTINPSDENSSEIGYRGLRSSAIGSEIDDLWELGDIVAYGREGSLVTAAEGGNRGAATEMT